LIRAKITITNNNGVVVYEITYSFDKGKISTEYGNLGDLANSNHAIRILNVLANLKEVLTRQINQLSKHIKGIRKNIDENESLYQ